MYYTVYKITNSLNKKIYIGVHKTTDLDDTYMGSGRYLKAAQQKHGIEKFSKEILYIFETEEEMYAMEEKLVSQSFLDSEETYNLIIGGNNHGWKCVNKSGRNVRKDSTKHLQTPEAKQKAKDAMARRTPEQKKRAAKKISKTIKRKIAEGILTPSFTGKKHTDHSKKLISAANSERQSAEKNSQYGSSWIHNDETGIARKIKMGDVLPNGWSYGRKSNKIKDLEILEKKNAKAAKLAQYHESRAMEFKALYDEYVIGGYEAVVKKFNYKHSKPNLVTMFARYIPEFVPQNGKPRKL